VFKELNGCFAPTLVYYTTVSSTNRVRGMSTPYRLGKRAEYELIKKLVRAGYAVMRAPASGAKAKKVFYPDVMAVKYKDGKYRVLIFEVKMRSRKIPIYIAGPKIWMLRDYARRSGGEAYVAVKIQPEKRWYVFPIEQLQEQKWEKGIRYVITVGMFEKALSLSDVIKM